MLGMSHRLGHQESHGHGTTGDGGAAVHQARKYCCRDIGLWSRAQKPFAEGHSYLDGDTHGEAWESLR